MIFNYPMIRALWLEIVKFYNEGKAQPNPKMLLNKDSLDTHYKRRVTTEMQIIYNLPMPQFWVDKYPSYFNLTSIKASV